MAGKKSIQNKTNLLKIGIGLQNGDQFMGEGPEGYILHHEMSPSPPPLALARLYRAASIVDIILSLKFYM